MKRRASAHRRAHFAGVLEELETRLLFNADAAALAGIDPLAVTPSGGDGSEVQAQPPAAPSASAQMSDGGTAQAAATSQVIVKPVELVFVDKGVKDAQDLVASIVAQQDGSRTLEIHWLDTSQDGVAQITDVLQGRQNVTALHLVTHGKDGVLQLGSTLLDAANLHVHASSLSEWGLSLAGEADLMIYGCDVAASSAGQRFIADIGLLTTADVAASIDDTGAQSLGGDWVLEYQAGQIQSASLIQQQGTAQWQGLLGLSASGGETIAHTPAGGTTQSTVTNRQVASDSAGNFVVVYQDGTSLKAQRFDADGTMNGAALLVTSTGTPANAQVAMNASGAFVVVWNDSTGNLLFRTYTSGGTAGSITTAAAKTSGSEGYPFYSATVTTTNVGGSVGINAAGDFVIAYREHRDIAPDVPWYPASAEDTIKWKAYTAAGAPQGSNGSGSVTGTVENTLQGASIGMNASGAFVVSYSDSSGNIHARRYNASRVAQGLGASDITGNTGGTQSSAAMDASGNYVIAYNDAGVIKFRMYNSAGTALTAVTNASTIAGTNSAPSVSMDTHGNFTIAWQNGSQDGSGNGVYIRSFNGSGTAFAADARVNTTTSGNQQAASVVITDSKAIAVWSGNGTGDSAGVFFQRYAFLNTAPTLTATGANPAFTEAAGAGTQAAAVSAFTGTSVSTAESGQAIGALTFTVGGIVDGASERIVVDGTAITLGADSAGTTATNGMSYNVTIAGGTATVTLTKAAGITAAATQTLVNGITYQNTSTDNPTAGNRVFTLTQVQDNGGTSGGGNDTTALAIVSTVAVASRNDAPTLTTTALGPTFTEAAGQGTQAAAVGVFAGTAVGTVEAGQTITSLTFTVSGIVNGASERIVVDGTAITLGANSAGTTATNGMGYSVTIAGGTATVTLTKAAGITTAATQTLVDAITYQNTSTDSPTAGNRVFTLTQIKDSGGTAHGGSDTTTLSQASTVTVVSRNDAPTLTATGANPTFTEAPGAGTQAAAVNVYSGTAASTIEPGQTVTSLTFTITGILDGASERISVDGVTITLGANSAGTTSTNTMAYSVTVAGGTATVTLTKAAGVSAANMQTLVNGITYQNTSADNPTAGNRVFTLTQVKDSGGTANGGGDTTALSIASTVAVASVNDAPTLTATGANPVFTEAAGVGTQAPAVSIYSGAAVGTVESTQAIGALTFTVGGIVDGASERIVVDGTAITLGADSAGTTATNGMSYNVTIAGGTATVTLTKAAGITSAATQTLVNGITYQNTSTDNPTAGDRVFTLTQVQDNGGTSGGGNDTTALAIVSTVAVASRNDAPTLTTTALGPTFTEAAGQGTQAAAVGVFAGTAVGTVEAGQTITSLTFTVSGIVNGASERIVVDGTAITLGANSAGTTATNGMNYSVTIAGGTATVTLTKAAGITTAATQTLVDAITYQNTSTDSPTAGNRVFTLTQIKDSGGTAHGGSDTTTLSQASTVTVVSRNDAPTLTATGANPTFTEAPGAGTQAAAVNVYSGTAASAIEPGQTVTSLTFTVSGIVNGASERIVVDGTAITLGANSAGTTSGNAMSYSVSIGGGTATITLTKGTGISAAATQTLVNGITYQNTSADNPTAGNRVFTLTQVKDSGGSANGGSDTRTLSIASTVNVVAVNDTPVANNDSTTIEVTTAADVAVRNNDSDPDNASASLAITIVSISPGLVSATVNPDGTIRVTAGGSVGTETVVYHITDPNGVQSAHATLTVTVSASAPPSSVDASATIAEDASYTYGTGDFAFVSNNMAQTFDAIRIVSLPPSGTLFLGGMAVAAGDVVTVAQLTAGQLTFEPATDGNGAPYTAFTFEVRDNFGTYASSPNTFTLDVTPVNDAPVLSGGIDFTPITEDDADNPGQLVSTLVNGSDADGAMAGGIAVRDLAPGRGTWQYSTDGGSNWTDVGAVSDSAALLLRGSDYLRFVPDGQNADTASIGFYAWDESAGTAGTTEDVTTRGGTTAFSTASGTSSISVTDVNDAPVVGGGHDFNPITEDQTSNGGQLVSSLITPTDIDTGAVNGVAIHNLASGNGTWQYSINGGANWLNVGAVSDSSALLLRATDLLRFVPDGQNADAASIGLRAWDQTSGSAGSKVDASVNGGATAFSAGQATSHIVVTAVNDAPLIGAVNDFAPIAEDDTANNGQLVSSLVTTTDVDGGADSGIAIHGQSAGHGTWQYSLDGGNSWAGIGTVSDSAALLLRATDRLRFVPDGRNADTASLSFHAWDQSAGGAGTLADATTRGGSTAFSSGSGTSNLTVTAVNDAPVLGGANAFDPITEDDTNNSGQLVSSLIDRSDVDAGALTGVAIYGQAAGNGAWQYSRDGGATWITLGPVSGTSALLLDATDRLRFVPDGQNGENVSVSFHAWDQATGVAGTLADVSTRGGATAFSNAGGTSTLSVTPVNDAPVLTGSVHFAAIGEDDTANAGQRVSSLITGSDIDTAATLGIALHGQNAGNGRWQYSLDNGGTWTDVGTVSGNATLLLRGSDRLRFVPDGRNADTASVSFSVWDQSTGTAGTHADATTRGGTSAFSVADGVSGITVTGLNDAPVAGGANDFDPITEDDTTNAGQTVGSLFNGTDADTGALRGIALAGQSSGNGTWQYSLDGGASWTNLGTVSHSSALLLRAVDRLRFVPDTLNADSASLSFHAWDQTTGTVGSRVDVSTSGGTTAFSSDTVTSSIAVTAVNDSPILSGSNNLGNVLEDDVHNAGTTVANLLGNHVAAVDAGSQTGIAVTAIDDSNGHWQHTADGGLTWTDIGAVSGNAALLLTSDSGSAVRFVPGTEWAGTASITFKAWDRTSGIAGGTADASTGGNGSAFSIADAVSTVTVVSINDAPVPTGASDLATIDEDAVLNPGHLVSDLFGSTDVDAGALAGVAVYNQSPGNGTWQYSTDGGTTWQALGSVSGTSARLLRATDHIRFLPDGQDGTTASLTVYAWDQTQGTAGGTGDASQRGGGAAYSTSGMTASISVTAVDDEGMPGGGSGNGGGTPPVLDRDDAPPATPTGPPVATAPEGGAGTGPIDLMDPTQDQPAADPGLSIPDLLDRIHGDLGAGKFSRDLLFQGRDGGLLPSYATAGGPAGYISVMQLLELIKPNLALESHDIDLLVTPISGTSHALPALGTRRGGQDGGPGGEPIISMPRMASYSTGLGLSIGTIWWTARVSGLVTSALISTPAWRSLDPLPVITSPHDDDPEHPGEHEDRDVEHLFDADRPLEEELPLIQ